MQLKILFFQSKFSQFDWIRAFLTIIYHLDNDELVQVCHYMRTPLQHTLVLQPPKIFFKTAFLPNKLCQMLPGNHFHILYASFDVYGVKLGGVVWVWGGGVIKENGRGRLVKSHDFYFAHFLNIWQHASNLLCRWESSFPYIFRRKSSVSTIF